MATSAQQPTATPRTRLGLSLSERIKVIEARQMGKSMRQLAAQFGCGKTQILNTLAQKERYIREWEVMGRNNPSIGARKRFRHTRNEQINRSVHEWYQKQAVTGLRITGPMLQRQARHYATHLGIANFAASNGWLANFRRFYNIISCSSHPKKQNLSHIQSADSVKTVKEHQQANTSSCETPVFASEDFKELNGNLNDSSLLASCGDIGGKSPAVEANNCGAASVQSESVSSDEDKFFPNAIDKSLITSIPIMCSVPSTNLPLDGDRTQKQAAERPSLQAEVPRITSPSIINHRKRRLLQVHLNEYTDTSFEVPAKPACVKEALHQVDERKIPKLQPLTPLKVFLAEFVGFARAQGLIVVWTKDEVENEWVEVREAVASYRVPKYGYPTHLARLIVDSNLQYYVEVLGHCAQKGSLLYKDNRLNYSEISSVLCALSGGNMVCDGVELVSDRLTEYHMRTVQEIGIAENMYASQPDQRYRSVDCSIWIDRHDGPRCPACRSVNNDFSASPIDLRCSSSHHQYLDH